MEICYKPIGIIHSPFKEPLGTPIQPSAGADIDATVEIFDRYSNGLKDLDGFSHIILLYHFHKSKKIALLVKPFMDNVERGVFATRAPSRPNHIGLSIVRFINIDGLLLHICDVDIVDGTPLLDIKPYVPRFDLRDNVSTGWLSERVKKLPHTKDDGRFAK